MRNKITKFLLVIVALLYVGFQLYFTLTDTVYFTSEEVLVGTNIENVAIQEQRLFKNKIPDNAVLDRYYFAGKAATENILPNSVILSNQLETASKEVVNQMIGEDAIELFSLIYVPLTRDQIYSSAKRNDLVNFQFWINPSALSALGPHVFADFGVYGVVDNVVKVDNLVVGADVYVLREQAGDFGMLLDMGEIRITRVFNDDIRNKSLTSILDVLGEFIGEVD